jgi:hypothetical protein
VALAMGLTTKSNMIRILKISMVMGVENKDSTLTIEMLIYITG